MRQWLHSPDPQFREKVNAICALYRQAPKGSVVLSIDEKTGIQAIERKHADRAPRPGRARRREFEYIRHGTQALTAALDVHSGRVLGRCTDRRTQDDLVAFMEEVARAYPKGRVHIVWDNLNTHRAQAVWKDFNARHGGRFVFHFTPLHASWVNQIELLFGIYARRVLRHASHTSIAQLRQRTEAFIAQRNARPSRSSGRSPALSCKLANPRSSPPMPTPLAQASAAELQRHLAQLTGHDRRPCASLRQAPADPDAPRRRHRYRGAIDRGRSQHATRPRFAATPAAGSRCRLSRRPEANRRTRHHPPGALPGSMIHKAIYGMSY